MSRKKKSKVLYYNPKRKILDRRKEVYTHVDTMIERRDQTYPEFNDDGGDQTLKQFIDDGDRRLNGYTLTRAEQGKEDHQNNLFTQVTRAKLRAVVAGVSMTFPEFSWIATKGGIRSPQRAEAIKQLEKYSRQHENPRLKMFWDSWECAGKGTVITYDGFMRSKEEVDVITSYDSFTGVAETKEEEVITEEKAIDEIVPLMELLIWDFYIHDIQDQPRIARIDYLDKEELETEYSEFENYKYLNDGKTVKSIGGSRFEGVAESYYFKKWQNRCEKNDNKFERIRYYSKAEKCYEIWINGVLMQKTPLIWGGKKSKIYPFAKTIYEPFSNRDFFYGLHLPKLLQSFQDVDNIMWNMVLDNAYRSLNPRVLSGLANKDLLDIEDELTTQDDVQYIPDVSQVKLMPTRGIQGGDIQLLNMVRSAMDFITIDPAQHGMANQSGVTARATMIANERAQELKGIFFMMLEDLWLQKTKLRVPNVLLNYMRPTIKNAIGETGAQTIMGAIAEYDVDDAMFSDGSRGTLGIAIVPDEESLPSLIDVEAKEEAMKEQGINYKQIVFTSGYLDEWNIDFKIIPTSLEKQSLSAQTATVAEKQSGMIQLYPEYVASNKEKLFAEFIEPYGESLEDYQPPQKQEESDIEKLLQDSESVLQDNEEQI